MNKWIVVIIMLLTAGCASWQQSPTADIGIEKVGSNMVHIGVVTAAVDDAGLRVRGNVLLQPGYTSLIAGYVRIEAVDAAGRIVHVERVALNRLGVRSHSAQFTTHIAIDRSEVQRLRIVHQIGSGPG